jgi:hypothetical protein
MLTGTENVVKGKCYPITGHQGLRGVEEVGGQHHALAALPPGDSIPGPSSP